MLRFMCQNKYLFLLKMNPIRININPYDDRSYYLKYKDELDYSNDVVNMFAYVRVSTQLQAQFGSSIATQIQMLYNECQREQYNEDGMKIKYNLIRTYVDSGISAKNIEDRLALVNLKHYVSSLVSGRTHQKLGIIAADLSRLTRSSVDLETLIAWINKDLIKLKFIDTSIDPTTNAGKLMLSMMSAFFEFERKNAAFKTKLTMRSMSENGTLTGHCSYGWTTGVNEHGRKINVRVPEEQNGLNKVIQISREHPELKPYQIKNIMNEIGIPYLRGPGRYFIVSKNKNKQSNNEIKWTGKWVTQIIENIIDHDHFDERKKLIIEKNQIGNVLNKDEIITQIIKNHLEETNSYDNKSFNFSEISRVVDSKNLFSKKVDSEYIKKLMEKARIINVVPKEIKIKHDEEIVEIVKKIIIDQNITTYIKLSKVLNEQNISLIGNRKSWSDVNVRHMCLKYNITL